MESTAETPINDNGVVAPPQDENKDATNFNVKTDEAGTPVARKTRGALRHKMEATAEKVSPPNAGKTTELPLYSETPRRSCRKSVRPAIDYDDIVRSAKKLVPEEHPDAEDDEESTAQKWNAAEVGRSNSRKRNGKSKRAAKKKQKTGDVETGMPEGARDEEELEKQEEPEHQEDSKELECQEENKEELEHLEVKEEEVEYQEENKEEFEQQDEEKDELKSQEEKKDVEHQENESSQNVETAVASKSTPKNDEIGVSPLSQVCSEGPGNEITPESFCKVTDADIDELGLCPLSQESNTDLTEDVKNLNNETKNSDGLGTCSMEVDNEDLEEVDKENAEGVNTTYVKSLEEMEDMPSLIMIDDEDSVGAENVQLNTTFDADDIKEDESVILIEDPGTQTTLEKPSVKVVLTTDDNKRETLLNMENSSPTVSNFTKKVSKEYRFPTPFKNKTSFKFSDEHKTSFDDGFFKKSSSQMLDMPLNTTFDVDDKKEDESVILIEVPGIQTTLEKPSVKVVLTTDDNKRETLLNMENSSPTVSTKRVSKGYRFPTPFKSKTSFKFSDEHKTSFEDGFFKKCSSQMLDMPEPKQGRRRSKSASHMNDVFSKTVSFQSPIEIANVEDIDKRWEALNKKNITSRRKRSKSLEEKPSKFSRIPKPKIVTIGKVVTPSKVKRAKLPNFAAIHEKQFSKMESLVDHIERKAERAKVLTNSALKQASATKKHQATTSKVDSVVRPKALKKIDLSAKSVAVEAPKQVSVEAAKDKVRPSRLPLKNAANVPSRPAFNLSTSIVTSFNTTLSRPAQDKLAERKQRHVELFKGRTKDKNNKGDFIKGVRSNRRFELQMQHRRHITED